MSEFTNDLSKLEQVRAWRDAAIADGWHIEPTYGHHEDVSRAARLMRGGFVVQLITRENVGQWKANVSLGGWAPDGMAISLPTVYDPAVFARSMRHCNYCHADDVETHRVGFAGRSCEACLPAQRALAEKPGWDL